MKGRDAFFFKIMTDVRFQEALDASREYREELSRLTTLNHLIETRTRNHSFTPDEEDVELTQLIILRDTLKKKITTHKET